MVVVFLSQATPGGGVLLESLARGQVFRGVENVVEPKNIIFDEFRVKGPIFTIIFEGIDLVSSFSSIEGTTVEETGVGVTLKESADSGFDSPEFLFLLKDEAIISSEVSFKVMQEVIGGVRRRSLDASDSG